MSPSGDGWFGRPILRPAKEPPLPQIQHPAGHPPDKLLYEDYIFEVTWDGKIVWEWLWHEHFDELGFNEAAKKTIYRNPNYEPISIEGVEAASWLHINSLSYVGPNRWYDAGDERFHPDNVIWDSRQANILGITDRKTGKIVWMLPIT